MKTFWKTFWTLIILAGLGGCATAPRRVTAPPDFSHASGVIFAVDGAGGFQATTAALEEAVREERLPLAVSTFEWSHGYGRILADQTDFVYARREGARLATWIEALRQTRPQGKIYLVGHSAGSAVVLAAAESLAPAAVNRIILLAPSISACYDIRPALRGAQDGMDVFLSEQDRAYLGLGVGIFGTADRQWSCPAAGRVGFNTSASSPEDCALYAKLRQHSWHPSVEWTGNDGGHYGGYENKFLRAYVLPLLQ